MKLVIKYIDLAWQLGSSNVETQIIHIATTSRNRSLYLTIFTPRTIEKGIESKFKFKLKLKLPMQMLL